MTDCKPLKKQLNDGDVVFGPWCVIPSADVTDIIASAGFDFVIIDREHGPASFETVSAMTRAARVSGVNAVVRLGTVDEEQILQSLDLGADGVLVAHVESGDDASEAVALSKYHPLGRRGFSPYTPAGSHGGGDITTHAQVQNGRTLVGVILEGSRGIENIDAVLETEYLDLLYIGAYDLSQALGMPGEVRAPAVRKALEATVRKSRDAGIAVGGFVASDADDMAWMVDIGMQFITYLPDRTVMHNAMRSAVDDFRKIAQ